MVPIPAHHEQGRVEVRVLGPLGKCRVVGGESAPVVDERLGIGVEELSVQRRVVSRAHLDPVGHGRNLDLVQGGADHVEEVADRLVAVCGQERRGRGPSVRGPGSVDAGPIGGVPSRHHPCPRLVVRQDRGADPSALPIGVHLTARPMLTEPIGRVDPRGPSVSDDLLGHLRDDHVERRIEPIRRVGQPIGQNLHRDALVDADSLVARVEDADHLDDVRRSGVRAQDEAFRNATVSRCLRGHRPIRRA